MVESQQADPTKTPRRHTIWPEHTHATLKEIQERHMRYTLLISMSAIIIIEAGYSRLLHALARHLYLQVPQAKRRDPPSQCPCYAVQTKRTNQCRNTRGPAAPARRPRLYSRKNWVITRSISSVVHRSSAGRYRAAAIPQLHRLHCGVPRLVARKDVDVVVVQRRSRYHQTMWMECSGDDG
jgi:hypothetical protein